MGQILNVILILVITVVMALLTSIFAYLFDQLTSTSVLRFLSKSIANMNLAVSG
jgi:hypothetical protein